MERIIIPCGGVGARMVDLDIPKCLAPIPVHGGTGTIPLLGRLLGQLEAAGYLDRVTLLLGYRAEIIRKQFPNIPFLMIQNPEAPRNLMSGIADALQQFDESTYLFILGDTIWSMAALKKVLTNTDQHMGLAFFGQSQVGGEMYAVYIVDDVGNEYLRRFCMERPAVFSPYGNRAKVVDGVPKKTMAFITAKFNDFFSHALVVLSPRFRKIHVSPVHDMDTIEDYQAICRNVKKGIYG
jgi:NDP-sugar pyrophosphorylase family protein